MSWIKWGGSPLDPFPLVESNDDARNDGIKVGTSLDSHENRSEAVLVSLWQAKGKDEPLLL